MNINDYKDGNGNVLVSEQLISDLIAIVESGSNPNGSYIKFSDGTMISSGYATRTSTGTTIDFGSIAFPHGFILNPTISAVKRETASQHWQGVLHVGNISNTSARFVLTDCVVGTPYTLDIIAIGRWK